MIHVYCIVKLVKIRVWYNQMVLCIISQYKNLKFHQSHFESKFL